MEREKNGLKRRLRSLATRAFHLLSSMKRERLEQKVVLKQGCRLLPVEACISGPPVHCTALYVNASRCKCECTHIQLVLPVCPDKVQEVLDGLPISPKSAPQPRRCCRLLQTAPGDKQQDYEDQLRIDRDREMNKQHAQLFTHAQTGKDRHRQTVKLASFRQFLVISSKIRRLSSG